MYRRCLFDQRNHIITEQVFGVKIHRHRAPLFTQVSPKFHRIFADKSPGQCYTFNSRVIWLLRRIHSPQETIEKKSIVLYNSVIVMCESAWKDPTFFRAFVEGARPQPKEATMRQVLVFAIIVLGLMLLTHASAGTTEAASPTTAYYVVRPGDTLDAIAWRYGVSTWAIARANGLWNPNLIYVGQLLVIPGSYPYPQPWPKPQPVPRPYGCYYWVQYGDTLLSIAARYHIDAWTLARTNGIYNLNWIYAGQMLRIPSCPVPPSPTPIPQRRNISGNWSSGGYVMQLTEAIGCPGPTCAVTGQFFEGTGSAASQVNGSVNVQTGAVSLTIAGNMPGAPTRYFNGTLEASSTRMCGQLTGISSICFTKQ
jgi:LysM repeat protein